MNTLSILIAWVAVIWLTLWAFNTVSQPTLGYAMVGANLLCILLLIWAVQSDFESWFGKDQEGE